MAIFETEAVTVIASKSSSGNGLVTPVSAVLNSTGLRTVRLTGCLEGNGGVGYRFGVRFSSDGFTWGAELVAPNAATWVTSTGWQAASAFFDPASLSGANDYPYMQVVAFARNAEADGKVKNGVLRARVETVDVVPMTVVTPLVVVQSLGSTSTAVFIPGTGGVEATRALSARFSVELRSSSGALKLRPGLQVSSDGETWTGGTGDITGYTTYLSSEGTGVGQTWADLTSALTARFVRFGWVVLNTSGTDIEMALAGLRVDLRGNG